MMMPIGKIMAECECISEVCEEHGFCMVARLAEVERERDGLASSLDYYVQKMNEFRDERDEARARVAAAYKEAASLMVEGRAYAVEEHGERSLIVKDMDARHDAILALARPSPL